MIFIKNWYWNLNKNDSKWIFIFISKNMEFLSIKRNEKIAAIITIRGEKARKFRERDLRVKENDPGTKIFSDSGNFGFGIEEHIEEVRTSYLLIEIKYILIQTIY